MRDRLRRLLREPRTGAPLELATFESRPAADGGDSEPAEGILYNAESGRAYPLMGGVASMLEDSFPQEFLDKHRDAISRHEVLSGLTLRAGNAEAWSFSNEWDEHFDAENTRTWGWTVEDRFQQFLMETGTEESALDGKLVLDAGCGNGALSDEISKRGAEVVGLDFSSSVYAAERNRATERVSFAQGDLQAPPFPAESFDLITSIGVLHHTPNTYETFKQVAPLVKPGGRFYVWLYRRPEDLLRRYIKFPAFDFARFFISRMPHAPQALCCNVHARIVYTLHQLRGAGGDIPFSEYVVSAYDDLACRWRFYHTPIEVAGWFHECGFGPPTLTHWDNPYGFGVVATREPQDATPGMHYGDGVKLWDSDRTLIG